MSLNNIAPPVTTPNQFQRADVNIPCGNGMIDAGDVTVISQWALNIGTPPPACGPTAPGVPAIVNPVETSGIFVPETVGRIIRGTRTKAAAGRTATLSFLIDSQGDEASISYTVEFPHETLSNPVVELGAGVPGESWLGTNMGDIANGRIGILVGTPNAYEAGTRQMITITFDVAPDAPAGTYPVTFSGARVGQSVSAANGGAILTDVTYESGHVVLVRNAAGVEVSGKVQTPDGRGLRNATVVLTDGEGNVRTTLTGSFGNYWFDDVEAGGSYVIAVTAKRYRFTSRSVNVSDSLADIDFVGQE